VNGVAYALQKELLLRLRVEESKVDWNLAPDSLHETHFLQAQVEFAVESVLHLVAYVVRLDFAIACLEVLALALPDDVFLYLLSVQAFVVLPNKLNKSRDHDFESVFQVIHLFSQVVR